MYTSTYNVDCEEEARGCFSVDAHVSSTCVVIVIALGSIWSWHLLPWIPFEQNLSNCIALPGNDT